VDAERLTEALVRGFWEGRLNEALGETDTLRVSGCTEPTDCEYREHLAEHIVHQQYHLARDGRELYPADEAHPAARVAAEQFDELKALVGGLDAGQRAELAALLGGDAA
jgi:hypothetical protein